MLARVFWANYVRVDNSVSGRVYRAGQKRSAYVFTFEKLFHLAPHALM